jgi:small neutral amino acid transporter SnatA (MarC family)
VTLAGLGLLTAPILNLLDLSAPTFRLASAVLAFLTGAMWLLTPVSPIEQLERESAPATLGLTLLLTPGPVFVAMAANADAGTVAGIASVAVAMGLVATMLLLPRLSEPTASWLTRFWGAITIALAVAIGLDAARTV